MAIALVCIVMGLTGCSGQKKYTVTVKDALGNPYTDGVIVQFLQDGKQVAIQSCDEEGVATKKLDKGEYTVAIMSTDDEVSFYYEEDLKLTEKERELEVVAAYRVNSEAQTLYVGSEEYDAYHLSKGCTYVDLTAEARTYFLFTPTEAGNYEFSIADDADVEIGYYGAPHYVQSVNAAEVVDNKFTISVSADMIGKGDTGTTVFVLGVDGKAKNCVIGIQRLGDAVKTLADEPWTIYETTAELETYTLPEGAQIKEFDLTASTDTYKLVLNEKDGFYHLKSADGPLVLVRLAEDCDYIACFKTMLDRSGVVKYFFDKDGEFEKKVSYSECLLEYIEYVDEANGVYPLTEDLKLIIQQRGDYAGWWDIESNGYIFKDVDGNNDSSINADIAWLLMCCYIEQDVSENDKEKSNNIIIANDCSDSLLGVACRMRR